MNPRMSITIQAKILKFSLNGEINKLKEALKELIQYAPFVISIKIFLAYQRIVATNLKAANVNNLQELKWSLLNIISDICSIIRQETGNSFEKYHEFFIRFATGVHSIGGVVVKIDELQRSGSIDNLCDYMNILALLIKGLLEGKDYLKNPDLLSSIFKSSVRSQEYRWRLAKYRELESHRISVLLSKEISPENFKKIIEVLLEEEYLEIWVAELNQSKIDLDKKYPKKNCWYAIEVQKLLIKKNPYGGKFLVTRNIFIYTWCCKKFLKKRLLQKDMLHI